MSTDDPDDDTAGTRTSGGSWQTDPFGRHEQRWWNGSSWTEKVRTAGATGIDAPGVVARPETPGAAVSKATPITDAAHPIRYTPLHLARLLLLGVVLLVAIVVLILVGIATA